MLGIFSLIGLSENWAKYSLPTHLPDLPPGSIGPRGRPAWVRLPPQGSATKPRLLKLWPWSYNLYPRPCSLKDWCRSLILAPWSWTLIRNLPERTTWVRAECRHQAAPRTKALGTQRQNVTGQPASRDQLFTTKITTKALESNHTKPPPALVAIVDLADSNRGLAGTKSGQKRAEILWFKRRGANTE